MTLQNHQFGSSAAKASLPRLGYFEVRATVGRWLSPRRRQPQHPLLQIGSGTNVLDGFDNIDFYLARHGTKRHVGHDLRRPLPYADESFAGVYSEHTLEHLYPDEALALLSEVHRVLKPGGVFRCSVPDLRKYVDFYEGRPVDGCFGAMFGSGCEAFWNLTQNHHHRSVWDAAMLQQQLQRRGFTDVREQPYRTGADPRLLVDLEERHWESVYVEGVK